MTLYLNLFITIKTINLKNITVNNLDKVIILENKDLNVGKLILTNNIKDLVKIGELSTEKFLEKNNYVIRKITF